MDSGIILGYILTFVGTLFTGWVLLKTNAGTNLIAKPDAIIKYQNALDKALLRIDELEKKNDIFEKIIESGKYRIIFTVSLGVDPSIENVSIESV